MIQQASTPPGQTPGSKKKTGLAAMIEAAGQPPAEEPGMLERAGQFAKSLVTDFRGLKDVGRGAANVAAGLLTAPGEGLARVVGAALPKERGLTDVITGKTQPHNWAMDAADALKGQREAAAGAVGGYETPIGPAAQIAGNLATSVMGGDPLATAAAAATPDASTLALVGDLLQKVSNGKGDVADQAAARIQQLAQSPATRAAVEYAFGRLTAGMASKVAAKLRGKAPKGQMPDRVETDPTKLLSDGTPRPELGPPMPGSRQITDGTKATPLPQMPDGEAIGPAIPMKGPRRMLNGPIPEARRIGDGSRLPATETGPLGPAVPMPGMVVGEPGPLTGPAILRGGDVGEPSDVLKVIRSSGRDRRTIGEIVASNAEAQAAMEQAGIDAQTVAARQQGRARVAPGLPPAMGEVPPSGSLVMPPAGYSTRSAAEQKALSELLNPAKAKRAKKGSLTDPGRANFFPGPEALASVATKPAATTAIGGTIGAIQNDDDRLQGFILGGAAGYGVGIGLRGLSRGLAARRMRESPTFRNAPAPVKAMYGVVSAAIDRGGTKELDALAKAKGDWKTRFRMFADAVADAERPIDRLSDRAVALGLKPLDSGSVAVNRALDVDTTLHRFFYSKPIDPMTGQDIGVSFRDVMEPLGNDLGQIKEAWEYAVSRRIADRGIDAFLGDQARYDAFKGVADILGQNPVYTAFADRLNQYTDALGRYAVSSGLWTADQWQAMKDADALYVPFRDLEAYVQRGQQLRPGSPTALNISKGIPKYGAKDPDFTIRDPAKALVEYTTRIIRRADQARVNRTLFDMADALGLEGESILTTLPDTDPRILHAKNAEMALAAAGMTPEQAAATAGLFVDKISGANQVIEAVGLDGKRRYALLNSPEIASALSAMRDTPGTRGNPAFMRVVSIPRRIATLAATGWNPRFFLLKNPIMDVPDAMLKTPGVKPKDVVKGFGASMRQAMYMHLQESMPGLANAIGPSPLADEASRFGLSNSSLFSAPLDPGSVTRQLSPASGMDVAASSIGRAAGEPIRFLEAAAAGVDMGPKLAVYHAMRRQLAQQGVSVVDRAAGAATKAARATVDYRRSSSIPFLQTIYAVVPFARASTLATKRYASFAKEHPARAATAASAAALLGLWEFALNRDDPNMTDRMGTERMQGPEFKINDGQTVIQIPLSPEVNVFRSGMYWAANQLTKDDPQAGKLLKESVLRALPPGISDYLASRDPLAAIPIPGLQGLLEADRNKTVFGQRSVTPERMKDLVPEEQRFPTTAPTFDAIAGGLRKTGIGPSVNPLQVENVVRDVSGGFTPGVLALTDPIARKVTGMDAKSRVPESVANSTLNPLSAVIKRTVPTRVESETDFYAFRERLTKASTTLNTLLKSAEETQEGTAARTAAVDRLRRFAEAHGPELNPEAQQLDADVGAIVKDLAAAEEQVRQAYQSGQMDATQARAKLDELRQVRQQVYRNATARIKALLEPQ